MSEAPWVAVIMGSRSDLEHLSPAIELLSELGIPHEVRIVSAHRTPDWMFEFAESAEARGLEVIIAAAGGAAHLPGMVAAKTLVPVLGVPVPATQLQGIDALLSIVQMPKGVPVGTLAIGKPGAANAALPNDASAVVTRLMSGTGVVVEETNADWSRVKANKPGWIQSSHLRALSDLPASLAEKRAAIVQDSQRMTGIPYLWGGTSGNGIDCSGLARLLHRWVGIEIPRDADLQCNAAKPVEPPYEIGDLFFFAEDDSKRNITHVGISLGGWKMIHSLRGRNGVYVDEVVDGTFLKKIFASAGSLDHLPAAEAITYMGDIAFAVVFGKEE